MVLLSLRPRAFRARNPGRDAETDEARLGTITNAISMAIADARRERDGLAQRLNMYNAQAAALLDNSAEYGRRERAEEVAIGTAETNGVRARQRIVQLDTQIKRLEELLGQAGQSFAAGEAAPSEGVA
jgi:acyl-CoA reductase-like NAD-dependent aldehyde dehydrogenase